MTSRSSALEKRPKLGSEDIDLAGADLKKQDQRFGQGAGQTQDGQPPPTYMTRLEGYLDKATVAQLTREGFWADMAASIDGLRDNRMNPGVHDAFKPWITDVGNQQGYGSEGGTQIAIERSNLADLLTEMLGFVGGGSGFSQEHRHEGYLDSLGGDELAVLHILFNTSDNNAIATSIDDQYDEEGRQVVQVVNPTDDVIANLLADGRFATVIVSGHGAEGDLYGVGSGGLSSNTGKDWLEETFGAVDENGKPLIESLFLDFCDSEHSAAHFRDLGIATLGWEGVVDMDVAEAARHVVTYGALTESDRAMDQSTMDGIADSFDGYGSGGLSGSEVSEGAEADAGYLRGLETVETFFEKLAQGPVALGEELDDPVYAQEEEDEAQERAPAQEEELPADRFLQYFAERNPMEEALANGSSRFVDSYYGEDTNEMPFRFRPMV